MRFWISSISLFCALLWPVAGHSAEFKENEVVGACMLLVARDPDVNFIFERFRTPHPADDGDIGVFLDLHDQSGGSWTVYCKFAPERPLRTTWIAYRPNYCHCEFIEVSDDKLALLNRALAANR